MSSIDINTLARQCGVSKATISRVFTGRARVSEQLRTRILNAARELNYRPQQVMARDCVAIVTDSNDFKEERIGFGGKLLTAVIYEITRREMIPEILPAHEIPKLYGSYTRAVLLLLTEEAIERHLPEIRSLAAPILTVNKQYPFASSVCTDHGEGVTLALRELYRLGHRKIGMTLDRFGNRAGDERADAYHRFMRSAGLPEFRLIQYCDSTPEASSENLSMLLNTGVTALIFCGESVALPALQELGRRRIRIPDDLSVITSEVAGVSRWLTPAVTTIDQNMQLLAQEIINQLTARIHDPQLPRCQTRLPSTLIRRSSVMPV